MQPCPLHIGFCQREGTSIAKKNDNNKWHPAKNAHDSKAPPTNFDALALSALALSIVGAQLTPELLRMLHSKLKDLLWEQGQGWWHERQLLWLWEAWSHET